jgi:hypothetical protein
MAAGEQTLLTVVEPNDLIHSLYAHIKRTTVLRDGFRVIPTARGQRFPVGPQHRCHFRVGDAGRPRAFVNEAAAKPPALVGQCDEVCAIGCDANSGYAPKAAVGRAQHETAAELQEAELATGGITNIECRNRLTANILRVGAQQTAIPALRRVSLRTKERLR